MPYSDADQELMELQRSALTTGVTAGRPGGDTATDPQAIATWEARRAAQREAHGQFVAAGPIYLGNCLAFSTGMAVPLEHVIRFQLDELEMVNRVATPELARVGKTFASDDEYMKANPHLTRRTALPAELHPAALDPRGGAAELDDLRRAGRAPVNAPAVGATTSGVGVSTERDALAADVAQDLRDNPPGEEAPAEDDDDKGSKPSRARGGKSAPKGE